MRAVLVLAAGALMLLSSVAHGALGWPAMRAELERAGAGDDLTGALSAGWYFGTAAMAAFGVIVVICGLRLRRADRSGTPVVLAVAACYLVFGLWAFLLHDFNPHFLLFVATGLLAGIPALGGG